MRSTRVATLDSTVSLGAGGGPSQQYLGDGFPAAVKVSPPGARLMSSDNDADGA